MSQTMNLNASSTKPPYPAAGHVFLCRLLSRRASSPIDNSNRTVGIPTSENWLYLNVQQCITYSQGIASAAFDMFISVTMYHPFV